MRIKEVVETSSTNDEIKRYLEGGEDIILSARRQTGGKGTKGRSFLSEEGGVYLSALFFYDNLPAARAFEIMAHAAVAVCRTAVSFGLEPEIKWPNDVLVRGKKLAGILIENELRGEKIRASIIGIGLNVQNDVSALGGIATSLSAETGKKISVEAARDELIKNLCHKDSFSEYLSFVRFLGRDVLVTEGARQYTAVPLRILPDGRLEIRENGAVRALSSAEISLKL